MDNGKPQIIRAIEFHPGMWLQASRIAASDESRGRHLATEGSPMLCLPPVISLAGATGAQFANPKAVFNVVANMLQSAWDFQESLLHVVYHSGKSAGSWLSVGSTDKTQLSDWLGMLFEADGVAAHISNEPLPREIYSFQHAAVVLGIPELKSAETDLRASPALEKIAHGLVNRPFAIATLARRCSRQEVELERFSLLERLNTIAFAAEPVAITEELNEGGKQALEKQAKISEQKEKATSFSGSMEHMTGLETNAEFSVPLNPLATGKIASKATSSLKLGVSGTQNWKSTSTIEAQVRAIDEQTAGRRLVLNAQRPPHPWAVELQSQIKLDVDRLKVSQCWDVAQIFLAQSEMDLRVLVQRFRSQVPMSRYGLVIPLQSLHKSWLTHLPGVSVTPGGSLQDLAQRLTYEELACLLCFPL